MDRFPINYEISDHEKQIVNFFGNDHVVNSTVSTEFEDLENVFICFTNRCGSNYLAEVIESTDYFPSSGEFFNWDTVIDNSKDANLVSLDDFCKKLINQRKKNNIFISKIGYLQLFMLSKFGQIPNIINNPKFIWIRRNDVVSQAVSLVIANQTKQWTSFQQPVDEKKAEYKYHEIMTSINEIIRANVMFENYFKLFNANYLSIFYEDFCEQPLEHMDHISKFLQHDDTKPDVAAVRTEIQRNALNEEFKARFLEDIKGSFTLDRLSLTDTV